MIAPVRVLVVDDSVVVRKLLSDTLAADPDIEVVGVAATGRIALAKIPLLRPDVVTLDVEMPDLDGLETLTEIRSAHRNLPVIMFSSVTERAAVITLQALALGATDYVMKPSRGSLEASRESIRTELVPRVKLFGGRAAGAQASRSIAPPRTPSPTMIPPRTPSPTMIPPRTPSPTMIPPRAPSPTMIPPRASSPIPPRASVAAGPIEIVAIGSSTGGPNALTAIFSQLPESFPVPIVIAQHMPPLFTKLLAEQLTRSSKILVREAEAGAILEPGHAWIAPGDHHLALRRELGSVRLEIHQGPHENSCRPAVDVLFRSVAEVYGSRALAVILTGMGKDGLRGAEILKAGGAQILAQDEASSVVWGMPGFIARSGLADAVVPIAQMHSEVRRRADARRVFAVEARRGP